MASPPQSFTLDRSIFNESLYSRLRDFWFADVPSDIRAPTFEISRKWFGVGKTPEEKAAFDNQCYANFGNALEALAPEKLALPEFQDYEKDIENSAELSAPLLKEVREAQAEDPKNGVQTLLSLILLLDQMPRNIYREPAGLRLVYGHYDRLAFTLLRSSMNLLPNPLEHESVIGRPIYGSWLQLPLMHSEHLPSHKLCLDLIKRDREECVRVGDDVAVAHIDRSMEFEIKHQEPMEKFGRYPHRNDALGRKNSKEEEEYMQTADTFGVKQQKTSEEAKTQTIDKSEL